MSQVTYFKLLYLTSPMSKRLPGLTKPSWRRRWQKRRILCLPKKVSKFQRTACSLFFRSSAAMFCPHWFYTLHYSKIASFIALFFIQTSNLHHQSLLCMHPSHILFAVSRSVSVDTVSAQLLPKSTISKCSTGSVILQKFIYIINDNLVCYNVLRSKWRLSHCTY